jgi:hypothetical protein
MKFEITAEKLVEDKTDGEYITSKYHRLSLSPEEVATVFWWSEHFDYGDDPEYDYGRGMYSGDMDGDLDYVTVDIFLEAVDERVNDTAWFDDDEEKQDRLKEIEPLRKYKGYQLTVHRKTEVK